MKNKLIEVLSIQSSSYEQFRVFAYIIRELKRMGIPYYTYNGCIYATKGHGVYPCVVSHMDTVHDMCEDLTVIEIDGNLTGFNRVLMEQTGIGGDDKVGVFITLQCLEKFDNIKAVFFRDEEVGCQGSYDADISFFDDCGFVLQCDRRGYGDFVTTASGTKLSSDEFQSSVASIIDNYGYKFTTGMMTDVMALKESGITCSMANMSCGYYNPHSAQEYVNVLEVQLCMDMVFDIISDCGGESYHFKYETKPSYKSYTTYKLDEPKPTLKWDDYTDWYSWDDKELWDKKPIDDSLCDDCGHTTKALTFLSEFNAWVCDVCYENYKNDLLS